MPRMPGIGPERFGGIRGRYPLRIEGQPSSPPLSRGFLLRPPKPELRMRSQASQDKSPNQEPRDHGGDMGGNHKCVEAGGRLPCQGEAVSSVGCFHGDEMNVFSE